MLNYQRVCENVVLFGKYPKKSDPVCFQYLHHCCAQKDPVAVAGVGKIGPWFEYVNGPFMLQSRRGEFFFRLTNLLPSGKKFTDLYSLRTGKIHHL